MHISVDEMMFKQQEKKGLLYNIFIAFRRVSLWNCRQRKCKGLYRRIAKVVYDQIINKQAFVKATFVSLKMNVGSI